MTLLPALEVGGTHVSCGLVDGQTWTLPNPPARLALDAHGSTSELLEAFATVAGQIAASAGAIWGVGMPDPFDYEAGIGRFHSVGKFESLANVDVRAALIDRITPRPGDVRFLNDAEAFLLGEWTVRGAPTHEKWAAVTLGTGVGSASLVDGELVRTGYPIPPGGRAHRLTVDGAPLEDVMSRRALIRSYFDATGREGVDVRELSALARNGDPAASSVISTALRSLGVALAPWLAEFDVVILGGSMTRSWDVLGPPFEAALRQHGATARLMSANDVDGSALIGAARHAVSDR